MARRTAVTLKRRRRRARPPRVEPVFTLLLTQLLPASEIAVPHGAVQVDYALFEALEQVEIQRALVQQVAGLHADPRPDPREIIGQGIHRSVDGLADSVTHGHRPEERHDQVRARPDAPHAKRLAEVLAALLDPPVLCRVEETADAERAVDQESRDLAPRAAPFALEQAVDRAREEPEIVEAGVDQHLEGLRYDLVVDLRGRFQEVPVEPPVELEHLLVEGLPGIVLLFDLVGVGGGGRLSARARSLRDGGRCALVALGGHALRPAREEPTLRHRRRELHGGDLTPRAHLSGARGGLGRHGREFRLGIAAVTRRGQSRAECRVAANGAGRGPAPSEEQCEDGERQDDRTAARVDSREPRQDESSRGAANRMRKPATIYLGMPSLVLRICPWTRGRKIGRASW